jgi:hypothetical protein
MTVQLPQTKLTFKFELFKIGKSNNTVLSLNEVIRLDPTQLGNFVIPNKTQFRFSQLVDIIFYHCKHVEKNIDDTLSIESVDSNTKNYIIPVAVAYSPNDWTDLFNGKPTDQKSIFEYINPKFLADLQNGNAMLLIDQSVEGYHTDWLWDWFHKKCVDYHISPQAIIYVTGDQSSADSYNQWLSNKNSTKLNITPSTTLSFYINQTYVNRGLNIVFDNLLKHKKDNASKIYLYDCINFRPRPQRIFNYLHLKNAGLLPDGNISIGTHPDWTVDLTKEQLKKYHLPIDIDTEILPRTIKEVTLTDATQYYQFVERILDNVYLNSWISIVTESSYFDHEHSVFISEKTFKPIACMQPFIIVGSKHTLKYLRKLGYRTFAGFIDESYDDLEDNERFSAIVNALTKIKNIEDKASWYKSMQDILEHNHKLFLSIKTNKFCEHTMIVKYYSEYFTE